MLPITLLLWIAAEAGAYFGIARLFGADWPFAVATAIGGVLGLRAGINMVTWMFGMAFASPAPRLGAGRTFRLMLREYAAFLITFLAVIPFECLWMPADRLRACHSPVLLVHGYGCSRGVWWRLRRRLEKAGHVVATISLFPPYQPMDAFVPALQKRIDEVLAATGAERLTVVAHSMGGLVARACLARDARIGRLVTLATPHAGTELARIGIGQNARDMEPGSAWLDQLAKMPLAVPVASLRNPYDNYSMPQDNQRLPGARDVELPPVGHLAMLYDETVAQRILEQLDEATP